MESSQRASETVKVARIRRAKVLGVRCAEVRPSFPAALLPSGAFAGSASVTGCGPQMESDGSKLAAVKTIGVEGAGLLGHDGPLT